MPWLYACAIGIGVGLGAGYVLERARVPPVVQSVAAALVAMLGGTALMWLVWAMRPAGLGAMFVGIGLDNLAFVLGLCLVAVVVHVALGRPGAPAALANHRAVALGCAGGLWGSLSVAWAMTVLDRLG